jgi:hypothetical protein
MEKTNVKDFNGTISSNALLKYGLESDNSRPNFLSTSFGVAPGLIIAHNPTGCAERAVSEEATNGKRRCGESTP